ncbi:MAG TPA: sigma-54 dependent transcriptional regulator [Syntrophales bacterium]|nr:sigma-54 dependent transcriptional regulator [Syntrophales bacterium]
MKHILVVTDDPKTCETIRTSFRGEGKVRSAPNAEACVDACRKDRFDYLFVDLDQLPDLAQAGAAEETGPDGGAAPEAGPESLFNGALQRIWQLQPSAEVVVMAPTDRIRQAVSAVKAGAANYLTYPLNRDEVKYVTDSIRESLLAQEELDYLRGRFWRSDILQMIQTANPLMRHVYSQVRTVAPTRSTVLLVGETGTGKSMLARLVHRHSNRAELPFISVHCGAVPETLLESELFGHERGAFTGAVTRKLGKFELARGGTIFLDEVGTMAPASQIKLLQVLQEKTFQRVGGQEEIESDVRILAASNMNLKTMVETGLFRSDLYFRLNVFPIELPPLRERREDIPLLVDVFLKDVNRFGRKGIHYVHPQVMEAFRRYAWPGNIRELQNLIERAYILEKTSVLTPGSFPAELIGAPAAPAAAAARNGAGMPTLAEVRNRAAREAEALHLKELLSQHRGRINATARAAGVTPRQIHKLLTRHGIRKEDYR